MANQYDIGDVVRCTGTFTDSAGENQDPDDVYFRLRMPSGSTTSYQYGTHQQLVKDAVGIYYVDVDADDDGWWHYRFESTGVGQSAGEQKFWVRESAFG